MSFHFHYHNSYCIVEDIINYPILRCNAARVSYIISSNQWVRGVPYQSWDVPEYPVKYYLVSYTDWD